MGKIAIISRESDNKTIDVSMLEAELLKRGHDVKVLSRLLTKDLSVHTLGYMTELVRQEAAIISSDVVVLDTYCIPASMLPHLKRTKVIQIWHALSAIKKFGWQTAGRQDGTSLRTARIMRMHRGYDYVISASDITAEHFSEAFDVSREKIVKYGLPRIDYIKSVSHGERRGDARRRIFTAYPRLASGGKKTVLYAPTFRRGQAVDVKSLADALDPDRYDLVVKLHPLYRAGGVTEEYGPNVIFDDSIMSYDWLAAADILISDYSSFVTEASLADIPLYLYTYDLDAYRSSTGLNVDFSREPVGKYSFADAEDLASELERPYDFNALSEFRDRYIDIDTDNCTSALAGFIETLT